MKFKIKVHNVIRQDDEIEAIVPHGENFKFKIPEMFDLDEKKYVTEVHGEQDKAILVQLGREVPVMTILRKKVRRKAEV